MAVEGCADLGSKDEAAVLVALAYPRHLVGLPRAVALECFHGPAGELHATAASGGLRGGEAVSRECAPDLEWASLQVNVLPLEAQQLALPQATVDGGCVVQRAPRCP